MKSIWFLRVLFILIGWKGGGVVNGQRGKFSFPSSLYETFITEGKTLRKNFFSVRIKSSSPIKYEMTSLIDSNSSSRCFTLFPAPPAGSGLVGGAGATCPTTPPSAQSNPLSKSPPSPLLPPSPQPQTRPATPRRAEMRASFTSQQPGRTPAGHPPNQRLTRAGARQAENARENTPALRHWLRRVWTLITSGRCNSPENRCNSPPGLPKSAAPRARLPKSLAGPDHWKRIDLPSAPR